jgi:hypothetical protein
MRSLRGTGFEFKQWRFKRRGAGSARHLGVLTSGLLRNS